MPKNQKGLKLMEFICPLDCQGCGCFSMPPCSHCVDHGYEEGGPYPEWYVEKLEKDRQWEEKVEKLNFLFYHVPSTKKV